MAWSNPEYGGKKNDSCGQNNDKPPIYCDLDLVDNWPAIPTSSVKKGVEALEKETG
jgi:hypothetical protein